MTKTRRIVGVALSILVGAAVVSAGAGDAEAKKGKAKAGAKAGKTAKTGAAGKAGLFAAEVAGALPAAAKKAPAALRGLLSKRLAHAGYGVNTLASLGDALVTLGCGDADEACLRELAATAEVDVLVAPSLAPEAGGLRVRVTLYVGGKSVGPGVDKAVAPAALATIEGDVDAALAALPRAAGLPGTGPDPVGAATGPGTIEVTTEPAGASVKLDGAAKGTSPVTIDKVKPGLHAVEATKDGHEPASESVMIEPGARATVALKLPGLHIVTAPGGDAGAGALGDDPFGEGGGGGAPGASGGAGAGGKRKLPVLGIGVAGGGAAVLAGSIFTGLGTMAAREDFEGHPTDTVSDFRALEDVVSRGRLFARLTTVLIIAGSAVIAGGAALALKDLFGGGGKPAKDGSAEPEEAAPAAAPAAAPRGGAK